MDKKFLRRCIVLPLVTAVVIGALFFVGVSRNVQRLLPVRNHVTVAYHETAPQENTSDDTVAKNDVIGEVNGLALRYDADYSYLADCISLLPQSSQMDAPGCLYLRVTQAQLPTVSQNTLTVTVGGSTCRYTFSEERTLANEARVLSVAPKAKRGAVLYYPVSDGAGLTAQVTALIFEEAE